MPRRITQTQTEGGRVRDSGGKKYLENNCPSVLFFFLNFFFFLLHLNLLIKHQHPPLPLFQHPKTTRIFFLVVKHFCMKVFCCPTALGGLPEAAISRDFGANYLMWMLQQAIAAVLDLSTVKQAAENHRQHRSLNCLTDFVYVFINFLFAWPGAQPLPSTSPVMSIPSHPELVSGVAHERLIWW